MVPSMEHSNPLFFVQLDDERRLLSLHLRITDLSIFLNFLILFFDFFFNSVLVCVLLSPGTVLKICVGKMLY